MHVPRNEHFVIKTLVNTDFEYKMVAEAFFATSEGKYNPDMGNVSRYIPKSKTIKIEKIYNPVIFDKFAGELRRTLIKYPSKSTWDLVKLMFHGSGTTDPKLIYSGEYGLDNRYSKAGMYGNGIYFADNSSYSFIY